MKKMEIERRFLLYPCSMKRFLHRHGFFYRKISLTQFYLATEDGGVERYRREGRKYLLTRKRGSGLSREEEEREIDEETFEKALPHRIGGIVEKRRYVFDFDGYRYELDVFRGRLKGLNVLEIEFEEEEEARGYVLPEPFRSIVIEEVTENGRFTNGAIAKSMRIPAIEKDLKELLERVARRDRFLKASTKVELTPYESGKHAVKVLLYTLLEAVDANRSAILSGDRNPERVHQLRVAMRKQRALLAQMAPLFEREWAGAHRRRLAELMRETGEKRDLDVYLMRIPFYRELLPGKLRAGVDDLETYLKRVSEEKETKLLAFLMSEPFENEMDALRRFARSDGMEGLDERAREPLVLPLKKALRKRYRKVLAKGSAIHRNSKAHLYHMVRIEVKKLRYLMEFFSSVFEREAYTEMLGKLKRIQTILGEHQDLDVQRKHLEKFSELPELHSGKTRAAIRELTKRMAELEEERRREFRKAFEEFSETERLFHRMICRF